MSTPTVTRPPARQGIASNASATRTVQPRPGDAAGVVLLVVMPDAVSKSAICLAAELAAGGQVIVMAIQRATPRLSPACPAGSAAPAAPSGSAEQERVRRVVAVAMSSLEDLGATALGHISVTRSPGRALARAVRSRGARAVVLDQQAAPRLRRAEADLTGELRRRLHGSGIIVAVASPDRPAPRHAVLPMSAERVDVVVIGAGLAGSAAAWALTRRGRSVVVFEAFEPGHTRGSSHGSARIFRRAYPDPLYVRLTGQAGQLWRQLESEADLEAPLLRVTGGLDYGRARYPEELHAVLTSCGVSAELLAPAEAAERWPDIAFGGAPGLGGPVMFHPEAGVIDPERAMAAMCALAASRGAEIYYGSPVSRVKITGSGAIVHTPERSVAADAVIVAAGPWVPPLIGDQVPLPPLTVTQQQAFHFAQRDPEAPWPIFIYKDELSLYGLPSGSDAPGMIKMGEHGYGASTTADTRDGIVNAAAKARLAEFVRENLPGLNPAAPGELTCLYTSTANEDFILDRRGPFVISSACSGHGAKFAPLIGEITADLACGKDQQEPRFTLASHMAQSIT